MSTWASSKTVPLSADDEAQILLLDDRRCPEQRLSLLQFGISLKVEFLVEQKHFMRSCIGKTSFLDANRRLAAAVIVLKTGLGKCC